MLVPPDQRGRAASIVPGRTVYIKGFGDDKFTVVRKAAVKSTFPHFICKTKSLHKNEDEYWLVPALTISFRTVNAIGKNRGFS